MTPVKKDTSGVSPASVWFMNCSNLVLHEHKPQHWAQPGFVTSLPHPRASDGPASFLLCLFRNQYVLTNEWPIAGTCLHESLASYSTWAVWRQLHTGICERLKWQRLLQRKKVWKPEVTKAVLTACLTVTNRNSCYHLWSYGEVIWWKDWH